ISKVALLDKAFLLKEIKDYRQAITVFQKAIGEGIDNPELRFTLGLCLEKVDRGEDAIEEYFKAIYAFSDQGGSNSGNSTNYDVKAYFRIARAYEKINKKEEAKKAYQKIIDLGVKEASIAKARLKELESR
ncbi:MAG: tetratricopeptide repeat protein, partial [Candidatus Omnitrophica bacterium]|nr:tetratricopeptide repeat protein [Candidatus Omnitrophota bacterium]